MKKIYFSIKGLALTTFILVLSILCFQKSYSQVVQTFNASGTFTVPAGITSIKVEAWGGGAGGSTGYHGGGGGAFAGNNALAVISGNTYTITVGAGGAALNPGANSSFAALVIAVGGNGNTGGTAAASTGTIKNSGGNGGGNSSGNGGSGGGGSGGAGGAGGVGATTINNTGALGGAAGAAGTGTPGAIGGSGGNNNVGGGTGTIPGGGGGENGNNGSGSGAGGRGSVIVSYFPIITSLGSASGCAGSSIIINGNNLTGATAANVKIGGTPVASITSINSAGTQITAVIGSGTTGTVTVTNAWGTATSASTFTINSPPSITIQPSSATQSVCQNGVATALSVSAIGSGLSYQWYSNTISSNIGGTSVVGATSATYAPSTSTVGTLYYYCIVSGACSPAVTSNVSGAITVKDLPIAGNITGTNAVCMGNTITLSSNATGPAPLTYTWAASGGAAIVNNAGVVTGSFAGISQITYTVTQANGCFVTSSNFPVTVDGIPTATAGGSQIVCQTGSATVSGATATNGTILWTHNGAGSLTNATTLTPTYTPAAGDAGNTVTLTMTVSSTNTCSPATATAVYSVIVKATPTASAGGSQTICRNGTATVSGATATNGTILWTENGAGTITSGSTTLTPTYTAAAGDAGNTVTLTMTVSNNPCPAATATYSVIVKGIPTATAGGSQTICQTGSATVSGATATNGTILWTHNGAGSLTNATTLTPTYTPVAGDGGNTVTLTMTVSNSPCAAATATYSVIVKATPTATAGGSQTICSNGTATVSGATATNGTILWTENGAGTITSGSTTLTPTYTAAAGDAGNTVTLTMTVSNNPCPAATATYSVIVKGIPTATAGGSQTICQTGSATVSGATATNGTILWTHNGAGSLTNATTLTPTYTPVAGDGGNTVTLTMTVSNSPCAAATATYSVIVKATPTATAGGSQTICSNGTATVSGATATNGTILWTENGAGTITSGSTTLTPTYTAAAGDAGNTVTLTMTVSNNPCPAATATYSVIVKGIPTATAGGSQTICQTGSATVSGATATNGTILWTHNGAGSLTNATTLTPTYTPVAGDGGNTVTLTMTVSNSPCAAATATYSVIVKATPTATAGGSQTICSNGTATVSGATATNGTILWTENGAGTITSGSTTLTPTYTAAAGDAGNTVTLTMTVSNNPCPAATATYSISVDILPTAAAGGSQTICQPGTATVSGATATNGTILWTHNGAGSLTNATTLTPTYTPGASDGGNTVTLTMTVTSNNNCSPATATATYFVTVNAPVNITSDPSPVTTCYTFPVSFTVGATGTGLTYQWYFNGNPLANGGNISGATASTLNILQATPGDVGNYHVTVTGLAPCTSLTSADATLAVNQQIVINTQPVPQTVCAGGTATFSINATGSFLTYQWRKGNIALVDGGIISGATTAILTLTSVTAADAAANYNVVINDAGGGCPQAFSANAALIVNPIPNAVATPSSQTICSSGSITTIAFSGSVTGTSYNWTRDNPGVTGTIGNSGSGNVSGTLINNTSAPITVTFTITPVASGCPGASITTTILVNPTPDAVATPSSQFICSGGNIVNIVLSGATSGTAFNWTRNNVATVTGIVASGSGDITGALTNTTALPITVTFTITPTANSCPGSPITATVLVNPTPALSSSLTPPDICSNITFSYSPTSNTTGTTFNWSRAVVAGISNGASTGTGNPNETLINTTAAPVSVTYVYTLSANTCPNTQNVVVIVNPKAVLTSTLAPAAVCSNTPFMYTPTSATSPITITWTRATVAGISNAAGSGSGSINETLINTTGSAINVTYVYILSAYGCSNTQNVVVSINPSNVTITPAASQTICNNTSTTPIVISSSVIGTTFSWVRSNTTNITGTSSGTGVIIPAIILANTTATIQTTTFTITATAPVTGCISATTVTVTVYPSQTAPIVTASQTVCLFADPDVLNATAATGGNGTYTYQWQRSLDNLVWTNIGGATSLTYQPPTINLGTPNYYYRIVATTGCGALNSNAVLIQPNNNLGFTFNTSGNPGSAVCPGTTFTYHIDAAHATSTAVRYSWSADPLYITPASGGPVGTTSGVIIFFRISQADIPFTTINNTNAPVTTTITVTPILYDYPGPPTGAQQCNATPETFTVTINPTVTAGIVSGATPLCIGQTTTYSSNGTIGGAWSSTNTAVATVNAGSGLVTAVGAGTTNITYKINSGCGSPVSAFKTLTVNPNVIAGTINGTTPLCIGATATYTTTGTAGGTWSSTNSAVASVNSSGLVTALTTGTSNITYSLNSGCGSPVSTFKTLTVSPNVTAGIISGTTPLCIGTTTIYTTTGTAGGTWTSTNSAVASVNSGGLVTALTAGTSNITYTVNSGCGSPVSNFQTLTVNPTVTAGTVSGTTPLCIAQTTIYTNAGATSGGTWTSSNTAVATVNSSGVVIPVGSGTTTITYTVNSGCGSPVSSSQLLSVSPDANAGIVSGTSPLCIGSTATYTSNGDAGGTWSSSNTLVATVNPFGLVTALTAGTSNITYKVTSGCNNPVSAFQTLTVSPNANAGNITGNASLCQGATLVYTSSGDPGGAWSSDNTAAITINSSGIAQAVGVGVANITYTVNSGCSSPVSVTKQVTVIPAKPANAGLITGSIHPCSGSAGFIYSIAPVANASNYFWIVPSGWSITSGAGTNTITVTTGGAGGTISVTPGNACGISTGSAISVTTPALGQWIGVTTDWNDGQNWCSGTPPNGTIDVTIPVVGVGYFYPTVSTAVAMSHNLTIASGASLTVMGNTLQIAGNINNAGGTFNVSNGTIEMNGSGAQIIPANVFLSNNLEDLIISNSSGVTLGGSLDIYGSLTYGLTNGKFFTGGFLTLKSNATATSSIGPMTLNNSLAGDVTVERYIGVGNFHAKSWQLLAIPHNGPQTINNAWQEGCLINMDCKPGFGTQITGAGGIAVGFDLYTATPSMKVWNSGAATYIGVSGTGIPIYNQKGYFLFVRGDRSVNSFSTTATTPTVLRTKGPLFTPTNPPPSGASAITVNAGQFESVGNPYASSIDMSKITLTGGVDPIFFVWDPGLGAGSAYGLGAIRTLAQLHLLGPLDDNFYATPAGGTGSYSGPFGTPYNSIQSGQAFFVQATGSNGTVGFDESSKTSGSILVNSPVRNPQLQQLLRTNLHGVNIDGSTFMMDGTLNSFGPAYNNAVDGKDARKNANTAENLSIRVAANLLSIERRQMVSQQDTIFLNLTGVRAQPYRYEFIAQNMNVEGLQGFVEDTYLHTRTPMDLNGTTLINFTIVNVPGSYASNRFRIVFTETAAGVLPVTFTSVKAYRQAANINVEWKVENERNIKDYDVEKSADGLHFKTMVTKAATGNGGNSANYLAADAQPVTGYNYYRVRSNDQDGKTQLTKVVRVLVGTIKQDISIYPNPITDGMIHLQFMNEPEGNYKIRLLNKIGQVILSKEVTRMDGSSTELIKWDFNLAHGMYQLEITKPDGSTKNINVMY